MSAHIIILTEGYATLEESQAGKYMRATGSCCLVRSGGKKILFDTMGPWEKDILIERLTKDAKVHPDEIDLLVCSHSHPDHIGNINLFTKATTGHIIGTSVYSRDVYDLNCFEPTGSYTYKSRRGVETEMVTHANINLDSNITIEPTPGHTLECVSMVVKNCDQHGTVALAGDLFEREEDVLDEGIWLAAGSQNPDQQRASRARLYNKVDCVLPGHGPLFRTSSKQIAF